MAFWSLAGSKLRKSWLPRLPNVKVCCVFVVAKLLWMLLMRKCLQCCVCSEEAEGYTSLYDDNQYEEIQPEVKFEGLRSVKELLLKV